METNVLVQLLERWHQEKRVPAELRPSEILTCLEELLKRVEALEKKKS